MGTIRSSDISSAILGNYAQNTGWLTLIACLTLAMFLIKYNNQDSLEFLPKSIVPTGMLVSLYAIIQKIGLDPVNWREPGWIVSTLGNPNFSSSYLGIVFLISVILFFPEKNAKRKFFFGVSVILNLMGCYLCNSDQGYAIIAVGSFLLTLNYVVRIRNLAYKFVMSSSLGILLISAITLLIIRKDEFAFIRDSLQFRLFYWQASLDIIRNNLFLGTGFGDFEDEFFKNRGVDHFLNGRGEFAASAHNYFLDFFSLGGLLLGTGYLFFCLLITYLLLSTTKRYWKENPKKMQVLVIGWVGFLLQSLVSIPVIPFLIFGTIIASLIAREYLVLEIFNGGKSSFKSKKSNLNVSNLISIGTLTLLTINLVLSSVIIHNENKLKKILDFTPITQLDLEQKMNDTRDLLAFCLYPEEYKFMLAKNLFNQGFGYQAESIMLDAAKNGLHAYNKFWYLAYFSMNIGRNEEAIRYFSRAKEFDPMNLNLRKDLYLLLQKNNDFIGASIELNELREIAPFSEQVKTLNPTD
jgi:tetratricopeptide (TPR) repeat protein